MEKKITKFCFPTAPLMENIKRQAEGEENRGIGLNLYAKNAIIISSLNSTAKRQ